MNNKQNLDTPTFVQIFSDLPLTGKKGLAFEFEGLAKTLAELAQNPENKTPFTVVVRGSWGRGKTTLLRQTQRLLGNAAENKEAIKAGLQRKVRAIWFNAWKYPSEDSVLAGLLGTLLDEFRKGDPIDQLKIHVDSHKGTLARMVLHAAAPWAFSKPTDAKGSYGRYGSVEEKRAFNDLFRDLFGQASYLLFHGTAAIKDTSGRKIEDLWNEAAQRKHTLAIFLDDLDRCREERVLEVLEAMNLFLDLPGVCFYLGLDWERLVSLLPQRLKGREDDFLEKIVQISLDLPEISDEGAKDYVGMLIRGTYLGDVLGEEITYDIATVAQLLASRHPRHVKRFLNDLAMRLAVLRNTGRLGKNSPQVPESAVVAWHLLREALPEDEWSQIRKLRQNLEGFLRRWAKLAKEMEGADKRPEDIGEELLRLYQQGTLTQHVEFLVGLDRAQLNTLVHLGSPPEEERAERTMTPERRAAKDSLAGLVWVEIPEGTFRMGSEEEEGRENERPIHEVTLSPFRISRYPITNAQYAEYVRATGAAPPHHWSRGRIPDGKENHPVVYVSWENAMELCAWLKERLALGENETLRLPTEAQWEYAARGKEGRQYPWGNGPPTEEHANFDMTVGDTTPVDAYPSGITPEGVYDLAGNVWEWCYDWYGRYGSEKQTNPEGPDKGTSRVLRGGAFGDVDDSLRCAFRNLGDPDFRDHGVGFRVVVSPFFSER